MGLRSSKEKKPKKQNNDSEVNKNNEANNDSVHGNHGNVHDQVSQNPYSNVEVINQNDVMKDRGVFPPPATNADNLHYQNAEDLQHGYPQSLPAHHDNNIEESSNGYLVFGGDGNIRNEEPQRGQGMVVHVQPIEEPKMSIEDLYVALYYYERRSEGELTINEGDTIKILSKDDENWWLAYHTITQEEGYVPVNYIAVVDSLDSEPWYFGNLKRREASQFVMISGNETGSFLVRDSLTSGDNGYTSPYSLTVRFGDKVKHYRIGKRENLWFITSIPDTKLNSVQEVINYFKQNQGLCCYLGKPCVNPEKPSTTGLSHSDEWELEKSSVQLIRKIGAGQFGDVWEGMTSNTRVAVKTLKEGTMKPESFLAEATLMKKLQHKNLIQLFAVCTKDEPIYIITEFMVNGDLLDYLRKGAGERLSENELIDMSAQIATGMSYLEEKCFIHRDLAARNILVGENNIVKVADFGLARLIEDDEYNPQAGGKFPVKWTAPEVITHSTYTIKSDVWSFGILLYEIISKGARPYTGTPNAEIITLLEAGYRMPKSPECPQRLYDIMLECWSADPYKRPTFETLTWELDDYYTNDINLPGYQTEQEFSQMEQTGSPNCNVQSSAQPSSSSNFGSQPRGNVIEQTQFSQHGQHSPVKSHHSTHNPQQNTSNTNEAPKKISLIKDRMAMFQN